MEIGASTPNPYDFRAKSSSRQTVGLRLSPTAAFSDTSKELPPRIAPIDLGLFVLRRLALQPVLKCTMHMNYNKVISVFSGQIEVGWLRFGHLESFP